ncbi:MAG: diphthine--ammonia ligase [Promethearchaeota archaeon]
MKEKILFTWSGGKDSAMALHKLLKSSNYQISALLTTITKDYDRISMHGVRTILLEKQAKSLGIPLEKVFISKNASNEEYDAKMKELLMEYYNKGVKFVAFGDIFLEDLRMYRENNLSLIGMKAFFPIWKKDTLEIAITFIQLGFKAVITCVDSSVLDKNFCGRFYDREFLRELPPDVDPCGENGEFHSFVFEGPIFKKSIAFSIGDIVLRDNRFYFCDLIPS